MTFGEVGSWEEEGCRVSSCLRVGILVFWECCCGGGDGFVGFVAFGSVGWFGG